MMTIKEIRQKFLDFFESKQHKIVAAAPIVNQNDPTLMFINSGMAQFKDYFLGNETPLAARIADTQKCLRVSGKHNDLEDVGMDGTHHTMFEMLGNWSFGNYFKKEAIAWAWELLTEVYKIDESRLYATVFGGDEKDGTPSDEDAKDLWKNYLPENRIIYGNKKDNFWEMGEVGPCGPCSEIHIDLRSEEERAKLAGEELVNKDHPLVIEIWNIVFMEFERRADKSLLKLKEQHVDTGMGLERLAMVLQGVNYTYDTDAFRPIITFLEDESGIKYTGSYEKTAKTDIAMRVVADHIRAVSLMIGDALLPSSNGAGYVLRRILRRAVRYYYSFLGIKSPIMYRLVPMMADMFDGVFDEVKAQKDQIAKIIKSEEVSFLRTLDKGLVRLEEMPINNGVLDGKLVFELYDTYGFPSDLTQLITEEKGYKIDKDGFDAALLEQKKRSREDAAKETGDWVELIPNFTDAEFTGYDELKDTAEVVKYRIVKVKKKEQYHVVLNRTPFYPEGGGQVGDTGLMFFGDEKVPVIDTKKENNLVIHYVKQLPKNIDHAVRTEVNASRRKLVENNHSATHLLHAALRQVLGTHVQQKGSYLNDKLLRFDFSHFEKMTNEQIQEVENIVNAKIRENISLIEDRAIGIEEAKEKGAMMLFGEKYGKTVRMITFDAGYSRELCGGCHVERTGQIGFFKITVETSIAAGVRRIEAVTAQAAEVYVQKALTELNAVRELLKNPKKTVDAVQRLQDDNKKLRKEVEKMHLLQTEIAQKQLRDLVEMIGDISFIGAKIEADDANVVKQLAHNLAQEFDKMAFVVGANIKGKANLTVYLSQSIIDEHGIDAKQIIKAVASEIRGGGGGQAFLATAGGSNPDGVEAAIAKAKTMLEETLAKA